MSSTHVSEFTDPIDVSLNGRVEASSGVRAAFNRLVRVLGAPLPYPGSTKKICKWKDRRLVVNLHRENKVLVNISVSCTQQDRKLDSGYYAAAGTDGRSVKNHNHSPEIAHGPHVFFQTERGDRLQEMLDGADAFIRAEQQRNAK
jgi:hypothetical protein